MNPVLDTNILIDYLKGSDKARKEIGRYESPAISLVTWMEVLVGADNDDEEAVLRDFLARFEIISITPEIANHAVTLRKQQRIRLPDAIIWASACCANTLLVTRNTRDFPRADPGIRIPYRL